MSSASNVELSAVLKASLPARLVSILHNAGEFCRVHGARLFIAGGWVRDLLLKHPGRDIDLVVEGDGLSLARELARQTGAEITSYDRFKTARLVLEQFTLDIATSRRETYPHPGSLPSVEPAPIEQDLRRRDFTINAMAVAVSGDDFGKLIDPLEGRLDLEKGVIRILHPESFRDDATRIFRAVRYEQRFGFTLEPATLEHLKDGKSYFATISPDRLRYEFECILHEAKPEKALLRAGELSVLSAVFPPLGFSRQQYGWFESARARYSPDLPTPAVYFGLIAQPLGAKETAELCPRLNLPAEICRVLADFRLLESRLEALSEPGLKPSRIFSLLEGLHPGAIRTGLIIAGQPEIRSNLERFLKELRHVKPLLGGHDLKLAGIPEGPRIGRILRAIQDARLDGTVVTRHDEIGLLNRLLANGI